MPAWITWTLSSLLILIGFLGAILPGLPGLPLMAAGALLHKLFLPGVLSWWTVAFFILVALVGLGLDFLVTLWAALWMHWTVVKVLHQASPDLTNKFEHDHSPEIPAEEKTGVGA